MAVFFSGPQVKRREGHLIASLGVEQEFGDFARIGGREAHRQVVDVRGAPTEFTHRHHLACAAAPSNRIVLTQCHRVVHELAETIESSMNP